MTRWLPFVPKLDPSKYVTIPKVVDSGCFVTCDPESKHRTLIFIPNHTAKRGDVYPCDRDKWQGHIKKVYYPWERFRKVAESPLAAC